MPDDNNEVSASNDDAPWVSVNDHLDKAHEYLCLAIYNDGYEDLDNRIRPAIEHIEFALQQLKRNTFHDASNIRRILYDKSPEFDYPCTCGNERDEHCPEHG